jgi:hypothetical protein
MPNYIHNKIIFDAVHADKVFAECCPDGKFDFNTLIPMPLYIYQGHIGEGENKEDFGEDNWLTWRYENWGNKWNHITLTAKPKTTKELFFFHTHGAYLEE